MLMSACYEPKRSVSFRVYWRGRSVAIRMAGRSVQAMPWTGRRWRFELQRPGKLAPGSTVDGRCRPPPALTGKSGEPARLGAWEPDGSYIATQIKSLREQRGISQLLAARSRDVALPDI